MTFYCYYKDISAVYKDGIFYSLKECERQNIKYDIVLNPIYNDALEITVRSLGLYFDGEDIRDFNREVKKQFFYRRKGDIYLSIENHERDDIESAILSSLSELSVDEMVAFTIAQDNQNVNELNKFRETAHIEPNSNFDALIERLRDLKTKINE